MNGACGSGRTHPIRRRLWATAQAAGAVRAQAGAGPDDETGIEWSADGCVAFNTQRDLKVSAVSGNGACGVHPDLVRIEALNRRGTA